MAVVKAKKSFAGIVTMGAGEVKEITDDAIVKDLLAAGYVEEVKQAYSKAPASAPAKKKKGDA
jgi:hypothetical protein